MHRASLNGHFANHLDSAEVADTSELHKRHQQYRRKDLDELQVYQDVELMEQHRWMTVGSNRFEIHVEGPGGSKPNFLGQAMV